MSATRFPFGLALGRENNFFARTDGLLGQADTTPDVSQGSVFYTNNTTNTTITHFDLDTTNRGPGFYEGKIIDVVFLDNSTQLANSNRLILSSSNNLLGTNNHLQLIYHNSAWLEQARSYNTTQYVQVTSSNIVGTGDVDVRGNVRCIEGLAATGSPLTIRRLINGSVGQTVTIWSPSSTLFLTVNSAATSTIAYTSSTSTTSFQMAASTQLSVILLGDRWYEQRAGVLYAGSM